MCNVFIRSLRWGSGMKMTLGERGWWVVGSGCYIKGNIRMHHFKLWMLHWGVVGIVLCTLGGGCYIKRATHACISALCISAHCALFYFALRDRWCWQLTIESNERMHRPCSMSRLMSSLVGCTALSDDALILQLCNVIRVANVKQRQKAGEIQTWNALESLMDSLDEA